MLSTPESSSVSVPENLSPAQAQKMARLSPGTYCLHKSWGFGQIKQWNAPEDCVVIDFKVKAGHGMQFAYAAESLIPLVETHILVKKATNLAGLREMAEKDPVELVRACLESLGSHATADGIMAMLSPEVVAESAYKRWWDAAKRALKKNGHFYVPSKKNEALRVLDAPSALGESALAILRVANGPKAILASMPNLIKHWPEIKQESLIPEVIEVLDATLAKIPKSQLPLQLELALIRDEFLVEAGRPVEEGPLSVTSLTPQTASALSQLLDSLPGAKQPKLLEALRQGLPDLWPELFVGLLAKANGRVAEVVTEAFQEADMESSVTGAIDRLIRERNVTCDFLFWLCKNRPPVYGKLIEPQLFMAILSVLEKDQFSEIKKGTKLYELVLSDKPLTAAILKDARVADVRDITRAILLSPVFEELDKRSLLATIIKLYPEVQAMVVGENKSQAAEARIIVSWPSLARKKAELEDIKTRLIPQNNEDLKIARGYGDLRENHEFKSAKEMQTILARREAETEQMLIRAQAVDFTEVDTTKVTLGCKVFLRDKSTGESLIYVILGAWDTDLSRHIISYQSAAAKALINHKEGDMVELTTDDGKGREVIVEKIEPHGVDLSVPA